MKRVTVAFVVCACMAAAAPAHRSKVSLDAAASAQTVIPVIVQWNCAVGSATAQLIASLGGVTISEFKSVNQGVYQIPAKQLAALDANPDVKYVSIDRPIHHKLDTTAAAVNASALWSAGLTGSGVGVAVIDSGINPDLNLTSIAYSQDFTGTVGLAAGRDQFGHGQHVAGIIAANGESTSFLGGPLTSFTRHFEGIAPSAKLIDLRVLDSTGVGTDSEVIAAIDRAIALKSAFNIRVMNISLGRPVFESYTVDPLCQAVEAAWKAGIVVVVAAGNEGRDNSYGNEGYGTITAPGNDPYVITVGAMKTEGTATRTDDLIATYSSKGPTVVDHIVKPDILAPGNRVVSLQAAKATLVAENAGNVVTKSYYEATNNGQGKKPSPNFFTLSGTSMAAPVVSGAAAALIQYKPSLTPDQVKLLLMQTASKTFPDSSSAVEPTTGVTYTDYYDIFTVGAGYVDLGAALAAVNILPAVGTAMSPTANYDPTTGEVTLSYDPSSVFANRSLWGTRCMWGTDAVWGAAVLSADRCMWGTNAVWGTTTTATRCMWGTSAGYAATSTTDAESSKVTLNGEQ